MVESLHLSALVGYEFYHVAFTVAAVLNCFIFTRYYIFITCIYIGYKVFRPLFEALFMSKLDPSGRGIFITGCDSGFGHKLAEVLDEAGFVVFASCLDEKGHGAKRLRSIGSKRMLVLEVDVTSQRHIDYAGKFVRKHLPRKGLWAIVNNAGMGSFCEVELGPVNYYEKLMDVNLYGQIRVCKQFLPLIRKTKGRIINMSSVHGRYSAPRDVIYEVSKHGVETFSDSLRLEMKKFGVFVSIIEPSAFRTSNGSEFNVNRRIKDLENMWQLSSSDVKKTYELDGLRSFIKAPREPRWPPGNELMPVMNAIQHAISSPLPNYRYLVSGAGKRISFVDEYVVLAKLNNIIPSWFADEYLAHWFHARKFRM